MLQPHYTLWNPSTSSVNLPLSYTMNHMRRHLFVLYIHIKECGSHIKSCRNSSSANMLSKKTKTEAYKGPFCWVSWGLKLWKVPAAEYLSTCESIASKSQREFNLCCRHTCLSFRQDVSEGCLHSHNTQNTLARTKTQHTVTHHKPSLSSRYIYNAVIDVKAARSRNREAKGGGTKE